MFSGITMALAVKGLALLVTALPVAWAANQVRRIIGARVHHDLLRSVLLWLDEVVETVVKEIQQTIVDELKKTGGQLTPEARHHIKSLALARIREYASSHGLERLKAILRLGEGTLERFIDSKVEAKVHDLRAETGVNERAGIRVPTPPFPARDEALLAEPLK